MTDINAKPGEPPQNVVKAAERPARGGAATAAERRETRFIELLFFAYRDFISDPDAVLIDYGFGRAHHRVIHFVNRHAGIRVADLLDILKITKQSLGRVLKQLLDLGFIEQQPGPQDRRQRLLYATEAGRALAARLSDPQIDRVGRALSALSPSEAKGAEEFLRLIVDAGERDKVARLIKR
jgi:DNA-binding MarR family transcriptional regulator